MNGNHLSRALLLCVVFALGACACGAAMSEEGVAPTAPAASSAVARPVTIEIGLLGLASSESRKPEWIMKEIESFMAAHPGIKVSTLRLNDDRTQTPLIGNPVMPRNIVGVFSPMGYEVAHLVKQEDIVPIDAFLPDPDFRKEDFYDSLWTGIQFQGKTWGVPWGAEVMLLACNWALFEQAGLAFPKTWDEFVEDCKVLTKDTNGDGQLDQVGYWPSMKGKGQYIMQLIAAQRGVPLTTDEGFVSYSSEVEEAAAYTQNIMKTVDAIAPNADGQRVPFGMTFVFSGSRLFNDVPSSIKRAYRLVNVPTCGQAVSGGLGTQYLVIRKSTPEEEQASWKLIKWILRKDASLPPDLGGYPLRRDFIAREDFKASLQNSYQGVEVIWETNALPSPYVPCAIFNRYSGLQDLTGLVSNDLRNGDDARRAWNAMAAELRTKNRVFLVSSINTYELYK